MITSHQEVVQLPLEPPALTPGTRQFTYDAADRLVTANGQAFVHDDDGNLVSGAINGQSTTLAYDSLNRLLKVGSDTYRYDADGLRIEATLSGNTTRYVWDPTTPGARVLEEQDGTGRITARYVYGLGLIGRAGADPQGFSVYHYNKRGSTVALTDLQGTITDRYAYGPYGAVLAQQGSTPNPFTYNGRDGVIDDHNGLYFMRARNYIPSLMLFAQADKKSRGSLLNTGSLNRYAFVDGNPIDNIDPNGDFFFVDTVIAGVAGAVLGGGIQAITNVIQHKPLFEDVAGAALSGAISGALVSTGVGAAIVIGGGSAAAGDALNQLIRGQKFDPVELGTSAALGGLLGGAGKGLGGTLASKAVATERTALASLERPGAQAAIRFHGPKTGPQLLKDFGKKFAKKLVKLGWKVGGPTNADIFHKAQVRQHELSTGFSFGIL